MKIEFIDEKVPSDKRERTVKDVFMTAGQIMFNYHRLVLKKDIRRIQTKYSIILAKK